METYITNFCFFNHSSQVTHAPAELSCPLPLSSTRLIHPQAPLRPGPSPLRGTILSSILQRGVSGFLSPPRECSKNAKAAGANRSQCGCGPHLRPSGTFWH
jgi:hypothetical protein